MPKTAKNKDSNSQLYRWAFTWWTEGDDNKEKLMTWLKQHGKKWVFQQERGGESNNLHWQGRVSLHSKQRKSTLIASLKTLNDIKQVHVSEEHEEAGSQFYSMKEDTKVDGPWTDKEKPRYIPPEWAAMPAFGWHSHVEDELRSQDGRKVLIVVDGTGGIGKSCFVKKILIEGGIAIPATMDTADKMMQCMYGQMDGRDPGKRVTVVIDIPRATGKTHAFWAKTCEVLESIKDGRAYDWRHTWKQCFFASPRVIVFTNSGPPLDLLSGDRWSIFSP